MHEVLLADRGYLAPFFLACHPQGAVGGYVNDLRHQVYARHRHGTYGLGSPGAGVEVDCHRFETASILTGQLNAVFAG
jgi:hypothetical protein